MSERDLPPPAAAQLAPGLRRGILAALALYVLAFLFLTWRATVFEPFADMYSWIDRYYRLAGDGDYGAYLFTPHNEHRVVWSLAVLWLDARIFGGSGWLFTAVGLASLFMTAALLAREAAAARPDLAPLAGALAAMLTLMGASVLDVSIPINTNYVHALVFAVAAIVLAEPLTGGRAGLHRLAAAAACACAAALGNSIGLAVWPALVFGAWRRGDGRARLALAGVGGLFCAAFLLLPPAILPAPTADHPASLRASALLFLNFLGLPFVRAVPPLGWLFGLVILALATLALLAPRGGGSGRSAGVARQLIVLSLASALLASIGRTNEGPPQNVPARYAVLLTPAHVGLLILALPGLARLRLRRPGQFQSVVAALMALFLVQQAVMGDFSIRTADMLHRVIAAFKAGDRDPTVVALVSPDPAFAVGLEARMRRDGLYQTGGR